MLGLPARGSGPPGPPGQQAREPGGSGGAGSPPGKVCPMYAILFPAYCREHQRNVYGIIEEFTVPHTRLGDPLQTLWRWS